MTLKFHTDTALSGALKEIFQRLEKEIALDVPVDAYLAGGIAVHLYTRMRVTTDIDAEFGRRIVIPPNLSTGVTLEETTCQESRRRLRWLSGFSKT